MASTLYNYFKRIELIKKQNKLVGIKPIDKVKLWQEFQDDLNGLKLSINISNAKAVLKDFKAIAEIQEKSLTLLRRVAYEYKTGTVTNDEIISFISEHYPSETDLIITNWEVCNGSIITEKFIEEFISIMTFRKGYVHKIIKTLNELVDNTDKFNNHSPGELKTQGKKGGLRKGEIGYLKFKTFIEANNINIRDYEGVSQHNFAIALKDFNYSLSPKTAQKYKDEYLNEKARK